jgi:hypothetical protein
VKVDLLPSTFSQTTDARCIQDTSAVAHSGALYLVTVTPDFKTCVCAGHLTDLQTQLTAELAESSPSSADLAQEIGPAAGGDVTV